MHVVIGGALALMAALLLAAPAVLMYLKAGAYMGYSPLGIATLGLSLLAVPLAIGGASAVFFGGLAVLMVGVGDLAKRLRRARVSR